jgi:2-polyprenyl-6-methoxyphenol hydroxylase-like FAD-dependent oxidoreductase
MQREDVDVAIVGFGPVGQVLAGLLGQAGHRVAVVERHQQPYGQPRAIRFDGEAMRIFQRLGITDRVAEDAVVADHYLWHGADGELILDLDVSSLHPSGWARDWAFFQPHLERTLIEHLDSLDSVTVHRGWIVDELSQRPDGATIGAGRADEAASREDRLEIDAAFVVGADGANSFVRGALGIGWNDLGFSENWLVCDVRPNDASILEDLPVAAQYCDPRRPHVTVRNGVHHRRWEFQLLPGEDPQAFGTDAQLAWGLLEPYIAPAAGTLVRHATYEFRSLLAEAMQRDRVFLAGDAAHLMPPFMAEGMCSGLRDANNLAWKLDQVLRDVADARLLDTYGSERMAQNETVVRVSLMMGQVACILDPEAAAERDGAFRSGQVPPPPPVPGLGDGVLRPMTDGGPDPAAALAVQGTVRLGGRTGLLDDLVGSPFALICRSGDPARLLDDEQIAFLRDAGAAIVTLDASVAGAAQDVDGRLVDWLDATQVQAVISRPDFYAFGGVRELAELPALVEDLRRYWS